MLMNGPLVSKSGFDKAKDKPLKVCQRFKETLKRLAGIFPNLTQIRLLFDSTDVVDSPGILKQTSQIDLSKRATNICNTKSKLQFNVCSLKNLTLKRLLAKVTFESLLAKSDSKET